MCCSCTSLVNWLPSSANALLPLNVLSSVPSAFILTSCPTGSPLYLVNEPATMNFPSAVTPMADAMLSNPVPPALKVASGVPSPFRRTSPHTLRPPTFLNAPA